MTKLSSFFSTRQLVLLCLGLLLQTSTAFLATAPSSLPRPSTLSTTSSRRSSRTELSVFRRQEVFGGLRRILFRGSARRRSSSSGSATLDQVETTPVELVDRVDELDLPTSGRVVEFQLTNLEGIPGKTGTVRIQLCPEWAPRGVARFEDLTASQFWDQCRIFRVIPGFVAQFGISGKPQVQATWRDKPITDDPVRFSNLRGTVCFAQGSGPMSRTSQIVIQTRPQGNAFLDAQGFAPFGYVLEGMDIVDQLYGGYGEGEPEGFGPNQALLQQKGDAYLAKFPKLSYITQAKFV